MAAIDELLAQIEDNALRARLKEEADRLRRDKKFGLVFEEHLPELAPIYSAEVRPGSLVAKRGEDLTDVWRVVSVEEGQARCLNRASGTHESFAVADLVAVLEFGDPIFPSLVPIDRVQNDAAYAPWHILIEADNYHALQLLEYLYAGQVDCIYIDPPYNTGARDWKYNNDYVDSNDHWRHSKWLAMMSRRLLLAKRLLDPTTGVLIVTIDEHEVHHLGMLLEQLFPEMYRQLVTIVVTPGGITQGRFSRVEEHAVFCFNADAFPAMHHDDLLSTEVHLAGTPSQSFWQSLIRRGVGSRREDRKGMFYPIYVDPANGRILNIGDMLPFEQIPDWDQAAERTVAWPVRSDGSLGRWRIGPASARELLAAGYLKLGGYDLERKTWTVLYLQKNTISEIASGVLDINARNPVTGAVEISYAEGFAKLRPIKTVWNRSIHHAGSHGSTLLRTILGQGSKFSFPKSIYATRDAIAPIVRERPNALVVDFFAGSGTTLHAVNLLNAMDGGHRRCIMVTNNEVSEDEAAMLTGQGYYPGDESWEKHGVCRSVTWPRSKYTILGKRDDSSQWDGEYLTGRTVIKKKARAFHQLGFIDPAMLTTALRKKELISLIDSIPTSEIKADTAHFVSADKRHTAAVLFDESQSGAFLDALDGMGHITDFYLVTQSNKHFDELKSQIEDLLGPLEVQEQEKRPMRDGLPANLEYFKLDFLDKNRVGLGKQFREILPLLWMRAGAVGVRHNVPFDEPIPAMVVPETNPFAVLVDETRFADFRDAVSSRSDITHLFLVTDSEDAFREMAAQLSSPHVIQLYRDYMENFMINRGELA